jgi:PAS domain S-box-containing protein
MNDSLLKQHEILDVLDTQIWQLTDPETYGAVNETHAAFFGMIKNNLAGERIEEIFPLETAEALSDRYTNVFQTGKSAHNIHRIENFRGETRYIAITKIPKPDSHGNVEYVLCSGIDVTDYKALETDLHHSNATLR